MRKKKSFSHFFLPDRSLSCLASTPTSTSGGTHKEEEEGFPSWSRTPSTTTAGTGPRSTSTTRGTRTRTGGGGGGRGTGTVLLFTLLFVSFVYSDDKRKVCQIKLILQYNIVIREYFFVHEFVKNRSTFVSITLLRSSLVANLRVFSLSPVLLLRCCGANHQKVFPPPSDTLGKTFCPSRP